MSNIYISNLARALAAQGLPVFPCAHDKRPIVSAGFWAASLDPVAIDRMFANPAAALIGVPTGERSGLAVLDLDPTDEAREWFRRHRDQLPETRTHRTRRGGLHLVYAWPGGKVPSTAGKLARGVDTRGDGGYVVWWPAHDGAVVRDVRRESLPLFPGRLLDLLAPPPPPPPPIARPSVSSRYTHAALQRAIAAVSTAREGTRNATLNRETFALARLIGPALTAGDVAAVMLAAAAVAGLPPREAQLTVTSALRARGAA